MKPIAIRLSQFVVLSGLLLSLPSSAQDWPQFLGPNRNLITACTNLNVTFPGDEPTALWHQEVGTGWSGPVVSNGKLVVHHRIQDEDVVTCFEALTGNRLWEYRSPTSYRDSLSANYGPRATPTIANGKVYTFSEAGVLSCLDLTNGHLIWTVDTVDKFQADTGFFGLDCSPLVTGGLVLMQIGGHDEHGIVAFDAATGKVKWHATNDEAGYSSPIAANIGGQRQAIFFTRAGLVSTDPDTGRIILRYAWRSRQDASVNAATPILVDGNIFLTASYDTGAVLLKVVGEGVRPLWRGGDILSSHYATPVYHRGLIFGFHGRVDYPTGAELRAVDAQTGKVMWKLDPIRSGTLLLANDLLFVLTENGELFVAPTSSLEFKPVVRSQILGAETRANSAFANGIYYARGKGKLIALDFRSTTAPAAK